MNNRSLRGWAAGGLLAGAAALAVYWLGRDAAPPAAAPAAAAAVSVNTVLAERRDFEVVLEVNGIVTPLEIVPIHPQVSSVISQVHIRDGQFVEAGQLLFTLDSRADQVAVTRAQAALQQNLARLADAERQYQRSRELVAQQFISQAALDTSLAQLEAQRAVVAADRAAVQAAQVSLGYSRIVAPSGGRVGSIDVSAGSYVEPASPLVTITQLDPIAVAFDLPQRYLQAALDKLAGGGAPVQASLPGSNGSNGGNGGNGSNGSNGQRDAAPLQGRLRFVDSAVDAQTGSVRVRAVFDNAEHRLWPGAFVNVRFNVETLSNAVQVPQAAIIQGTSGQSLYVVGPDGRAALRTVEVLHSVGPMAAVSGLQGGERVVLEGRQNLRPGALVAERKPGAAAVAGVP